MNYKFVIVPLFDSLYLTDEGGLKAVTLIKSYVNNINELHSIDI